MNSLNETLVAFSANLLITIIIVRLVYYPRKPDRNYIFAFFALNTIVFFVMRLLTSFDIGLGAGFGLFAIFSILRYRTDTIPIREMTYLFVLIALPVVNSTLLTNGTYAEFALTNAAIIVVLYVMEKGWGFRHHGRKYIVYDRVDLIQPENWQLLLDDLCQRTGLPVTHVEIGNLNLLRDTAEITIYYKMNPLENAQVSITPSAGSHNDRND